MAGAPADTATYKTRILVYRPTNPKKFRGTVVVEWLNVSGGVDAGPNASAPVRVLELAGTGALRTRFDVSRSRGLSRFVGRGDETAILDATLERALAGDASMIGVVADAGTGKSRLCFELLERCRARGSATTVASGVAHGKAVPLLPILELLRNSFGINDHDAAWTAREKIAGRLLLLDESLRDDLPLAFDFLGVPDPDRPAPALDASERQRKIFALFRRVTELRGRRAPTVTLLEDLHWFDASSESFLEPLVDARPGTRALLALNFRPEYHAPWMQRSWYHQLPLRPLGPGAQQELLRELLGSDFSLAGLAARLGERTGGNPFFLEETVLSLAESGALAGTPGSYRLTRPLEELAVPTTVQAILAARIDRLGEREKTLLQTASVLGRELPEALLRRVADLPEADLAEALRTLVRDEFLYEAALYPEPEYAFKHPLTQEVAYQSQLADKRARARRRGGRTRSAGSGRNRRTRGAARVPLRGRGRGAPRSALARPRGPLGAARRLRRGA